MARTSPTDRTRRRFARRQWARRWLTWRYVAGALVLALVVGGGVYAVYFSPVLSVKGVQVSGEDLLSRDDVLATAAVPTGGPLATADLVAIERRLAALAPVAEVDVTRQWPSDVHIELTERVPVAVVRRGDELRAVDAEGVLFLDYRTPPPGMPRIDTSIDVDRGALAESAEVVASLPATIAGLVDHVTLTSADEIDLALRDGRLVRWGSAADSTQKSEVLGALLGREAKTYDVSVPGQPTIAG